MSRAEVHTDCGLAWILPSPKENTPDTGKGGGRMNMRRMIVGLAAASSLCLTVALVSAAEDASDGTLELKGGSVAAGVGFSWGSGTLTYKGRRYPIVAKGFDVGDVGITNVTASGKVYNLQKLKDFDGNYTGVGAAAAAAGVC